MTKNIIEIKNLCKSYPFGKNEKVDVLFDINLSVKEGEFAVIVGPSGSGKSTLINIIGCLDGFNTGSYVLDKENVKKLSSGDLASIRNKKIGFIFQSFNLLPKMTIYSNVELPLIYASVSAKERKIRVEEILKKVGLWERRNHRPNEISGGQKQRTAIARALVTKPSLILADEPTGNLDSLTTNEIMKMMTDLHKEGNTIVLITHESDVAEYGEKVYSIIDGNLKLEN